MKNMLTYKGFVARIDFDPEDQLLVGRLAGINDVIGFHSEDAAGIAPAFHEAVDDYLAACEKLGRKPQKPYSGKLMLRVAPAIHGGAAMAAQIAGVSLNQWSEEVLRAAVEKVVPLGATG